jgi:hypothetical protein
MIKNDRTSICIHTYNLIAVVMGSIEPLVRMFWEYAFLLHNNILSAITDKLNSLMKLKAKSHENEHVFGQFSLRYGLRMYIWILHCESCWLWKDPGCDQSSTSHRITQWIFLWPSSWIAVNVSNPIQWDSSPEKKNMVIYSTGWHWGYVLKRKRTEKMAYYGDYSLLT